MTSDGLSESHVRNEVRKLVSEYTRLKNSMGEKKLPEISEADVRADFIDPLFEMLGWNVRKPSEYNREKYVRGAGFADIAIQLGGEAVAFIEAKRFGSIPPVNRNETDWIEQERQVMNYAMTHGIKWAVLTNFEVLRLFNAMNGNLIFSIDTPYEYADKVKYLMLLSKESFKNGEIERFGEHEEKPDIDLDFLERLNRWRLALANDIYRRNGENKALMENGEFSLELLMNAVQRLLDRMIIVRYAEDRLILDNPDQMMAIKNAWEPTKAYTSLYSMLLEFFKGFDRIHDSSIFERGHICERVEMDSEVLARVIDEMYAVNFRKFDFDILGNTYETYLGNVLDFGNGGIVLRPAQESRKKSGIYYTPPYVVDYIVKNTLGELIRGKSAEEVGKIKVLDPSCGSASFLIKAYDYFIGFYEGENERIEERKREILQEIGRNGNGVSDFSALEGLKRHEGYEKEILKRNIYGVDLDGHAAEIASVNLMLKALRKKEKLPLILGDHIKVGNSLISGDEATLKKYFGDDWKDKRPFNWEEEFPEVFQGDNPGFDVIIGNPPYIRVQNLPEEDRKFFAENYRSALGSYDIYVLFVEKAIELLKDGGRFSFIMPLKFFQADYGKKLRKLILDTCNIDMIVDFGTTKVFGDATTYPCLLFLTKTKKRKKKLKYIRIKRSAPDLKEIAEKGLDRKSALNERFEVFDVSQDLLTEETWNFLRKEEEDVFSRLNQVKRTLSNITEDIFQGITTGADSIFFLKIEKELEDGKVEVVTGLGEKSIIETKFLKPLLKGKDIRRWNIAYDGYHVLFLYDLVDGKAVLYNQKDIKRNAPLTWDYLKKYERDLKSREDGKWKNTEEWYDHSYRKNLEKFSQHKILTQVLAKRASFTFDREGKYYFVGGGNAGGYGVVLNEEFGNSPEKYLFVLALLNSKLLDFYLHSISTKFQNDYHSYAKRFIERLPIAEAEPEQEKELAGLADKMLSLNERLAEIDVDFERHLNRLPVEGKAKLSEYLDSRDVMKDVSGKGLNEFSCDGKLCKFRGLEVAESGEELIFRIKVEEVKKGGGTSERRFVLLRAKVKDEQMRKFLYFWLNTFVKPSKIGKGVVLKKILNLKLPRFETSNKRNLEVINELMDEYLPKLEKWKELKKEIDKTDALIDSKVYELYGLREDEIKIIEESFGDE